MDLLCWPPRLLPPLARLPLLLSSLYCWLPWAWWVWWHGYCCQGWRRQFLVQRQRGDCCVVICFSRTVSVLSSPCPQLSFRPPGRNTLRSVQSCVLRYQVRPQTILSSAGGSDVTMADYISEDKILQFKAD